MIKIGIFGNLDARKREFSHILSSQLNCKINDLPNFTNETLTGYPGDKPVTIAKTLDYKIVEYPHAFYPHKFLNCDYHLIILSENSQNLAYMTHRIESEIIFLKWRDEVDQIKDHEIDDIVDIENFDGQAIIIKKD